MRHRFGAADISQPKILASLTSINEVGRWNWEDMVVWLIVKLQDLTSDRELRDYSVTA